MSHPTATETQLVQNMVDALEPYAQPLIPPSLPLRLFPACKPLSPLERAAAAASSASSELAQPIHAPSPASSVAPPSPEGEEEEERARRMATSALGLAERQCHDLLGEEKRVQEIKAYMARALHDFAREPAVALERERAAAAAPPLPLLLPACKPLSPLEAAALDAATTTHHRTIPTPPLRPTPEFAVIQDTRNAGFDDSIPDLASSPPSSSAELEAQPTPHSSPSSLAASLSIDGEAETRAADIQPFMDAYVARYGQVSTGNTDVAAVIGRHVKQVAVDHSQANMKFHYQMLGPAYYSKIAPAQTRVYMTPKADATALPDNREILILEDLTDEERRKYGINTNAAGAAALAPVGALRLPAEPPRLAPLPDHGLERGAPRIEMQRYATRRVLAWMLAAKDQRPVEFRHVETCTVSTYAEFKLFNCAAPALDLPDDFPVVAYTTDDGSTLRLPSREFPHPDELFLVRVEDEWVTPRLDRTTFELREDASDSDSDDEILPNLESVDVRDDDSPMPTLAAASPRPTIVLVPAEPWLLPAMTAFDEDRATPADRALLAFGNMYADVKYWATRNPAARCDNCVAMCDAAAAYAAAVHVAAPPPTPSSPRAPKPMSAGEKATIDAIMASHRIVSLLTPADADPRAHTKEDVHPAVAAFTPSAIRLQRWFREGQKAKVDAVNDDSAPFPAAMLDRFCVRLADTEGMPDLSTLAMPAAARESVRIEQSESTPTFGAMQGEPSGSRSMPFVDRFAVRTPPSPPVD